MDSKQKRNFLIILVLGILYFIAFIFPNSTGAKDEHTLFLTSQDENITYGYTLNMVTPGKDIHETRYRWISYGDYHYGYPFYLSSALVLLPVRLIYGDAFRQQTQLNLLLLRQLINVLPMTIAIITLVYLQTRFKSLLRSVVLFVFLASILGVVRSNIRWWHPDILAILGIVLTLFSLDRDNLRFGRWFYIAAITCGFAVGVKMMGVFFVLTIPGYILTGWLQKRIPLKKAFFCAAMFVLVMCATVIATNPLLLLERERTKIIAMQSKVSYEITHGWANDDPYETGLLSWLPYLQQYYGNPLFLIFISLSLLAGCWWGPRRITNRLVAGWVATYLTYVFTFVAVKPDHYVLPAMLPMTSALLNLIPWGLDEKEKNQWTGLRQPHLGWGTLIALLAALVIVFQLSQNLAGNFTQFSNALNQEKVYNESQ